MIREVRGYPLLAGVRGRLAADQQSLTKTLQEGMYFDAETGSGHHLLLDAAEHNGGDDRGPRPMEMLLVALVTCAGMDILAILGRNAGIEKIRSPTILAKQLVDPTLMYVHPQNNSRTRIASGAAGEEAVAASKQDQFFN